ncbi:MAG: dTDP-4-amino-4,6-dideoxygalactose transaminase [Lachnospiraceae bacterium]|nr:dTDP-4-amino-4,6-dideoxygalactose transaminase [Lachnospiraceae bacterium]
MIPFNKASLSDIEKEYVLDAMETAHLSGDGKYTFKVYDFFKERFGIENFRLTTSGTTALEMAAILTRIGPGDEFIVPSFTFSSTVNAFLLRGATPVFCDIRKDTYNIDESLIESLITDKTKVIITVDYAGIPAEYDKINEIAKRHSLLVVADAAQSVGSTYKGEYSGNLAPISCFSFHETKNYCMGEGGGIVVRPDDLDRADIIREKGTNRRQVLNGMTDKYTWHDIGSSFLPSDVLCAMLYAQLTRYDEIMEKRRNIWYGYLQGLENLEKKGFFQLPSVPEGIIHNGHMFNICLNKAKDRDDLVTFLNGLGIKAYVCYVPLHSSPMGKTLGWDTGMLPVTEFCGGTVLRLPLYADMTYSDVSEVCDGIGKFFREYSKVSGGKM